MLLSRRIAVALVIVQSFELGSNEFSLRLGGAEDPKAVKEKVSTALKASYQDKFEILKTDFVGPTVGKELRRKALIACLIGLVGILLYVGFRFEASFAVGAVVALFHDVIIAMGIVLAAGHEVSMGTLAVALTIVGYSVNDTIIIFDRIREEILKRKDFELIPLFNEAISCTLSRTIITSILTLFSALALYLLGGGPIEDISLFLVVGIVVGTYSSIFIASPLVLAWEWVRGPGKPAAA